MLIKDIRPGADCSGCSTLQTQGLNNQLIAIVNRNHPGLLVKIDDLNVDLAPEVYPWLQAPGRYALQKAIAAAPDRKLKINSALRTIAAQAQLYNLNQLQLDGNPCQFQLVGYPGQSNHQNASAFDCDDADGWKPILEDHGWQKLAAETMHFDCTADDIQDIRGYQVGAFQQLWNECYPKDQLLEDGVLGDVTYQRLLYSPAEGFPDIKECPRVLRLTQPVQVGADVGKLQVALRKAGISLTRANCIFDAATDKAVKQFQSKHNLAADGVVRATTQKLLPT